ncbi:MAG: hypothetical protein PHG91_02025 [Syntrophales bacterium]|nr:hypothetical protein [Syntrophales bacterium]MDD5532498.1 hypothetical protein [Syntrophales bacterium]HPL62935.1 hypothetical protein [Syntrophales bacterium]
MKSSRKTKKQLLEAPEASRRRTGRPGKSAVGLEQFETALRGNEDVLGLIGDNMTDVIILSDL